VTVFFSVVPASTSQDFTISASPTNVTITAGSTGTSTLNVTSINNFAGTVFLTATVSSSGPTTNLNPANITLSGGGTANSILTVSTTASTPAGFYIVTVTGNSPSIGKSHSFQVGVTVTNPTPPDFKISANPIHVVVQANSNGFSTITITGLNGFSSTVSLTLSSTPGLVANISPHNITGSGSATLTVSAAVAGNYTSIITGTSGSLSHSATVFVNITAPQPPPDFTITAGPTSQSVSRGSTTSFTITITGKNGFNGTVTLTATVSPVVRNGPTITLPSTVGPFSNSTLTVSTVHKTPLGSYTITIMATSGSLTHSVTVTVTVTR
jgi:hypothetical protein